MKTVSDTDSLARSMRLSIVEGGFTTAMGCLFSGLFLTGFVLTIGATRLQVGILFALPSLCGVAQLLGSYWIERDGKTKRLCLWSSALSRVLYLPVLAVPLLLTGISDIGKVWLIVGLMAMSQIFASLGGVAWLSWTKVLVPDKSRLPFLGRRNLLTTSLSFLVCMLGAGLLDLVSGDDRRFLGFTIVFTGAMVCGIVGWLILWKIPAANAAVSSEESFRRKMLVPLRQPNFRRVVFFYAAWNLSVNLAAPFIPVFLLQELRLPFGCIMALSTLNSIAGIAANGFWTRMAQRFGMKPVVFLATVGDACGPLLLLFVNAQHWWILVGIHLLGIFNTPIALGPDNFMLKLTPDRSASAYMAVFRTIVGSVTAVAVVLGGWLASSWSESSMVIEQVNMSGLKIVFLISFLGRLASLSLLSGVVESEARSLGYVVEALRRARHWTRPRVAPLVIFPWLPRPHWGLRAESRPLQPSIAAPAMGTAFARMKTSPASAASELECFPEATSPNI